jgi:hypothetical protein
MLVYSTRRECRMTHAARGEYRKACSLWEKAGQHMPRREISGLANAARKECRIVYATCGEAGKCSENAGVKLIAGIY